MNRTQKLVLVPGLIIVFFIIPALSAPTPGNALGNYKGPLSKLFPNRVGSFKRSTPPSHWTAQIRGLNLNEKEAFFAYYQLGIPDRSDGRIRAFNFSSSDEAKEGLRKIKAFLLNQNDQMVSSEGVKRKGNTVVGDRLEGNGDFMGHKNIILWTNGSVLFFLVNEDMPRDYQQEQYKRDILDFENSFPY